MPINQAMFEALQPGVNQLARNKADAAAAEREAALKKYLQGQKEGSVDESGNLTKGTDALSKEAVETARQSQAQQMLKDPTLQDSVRNGGSYSYDPETGKFAIGADPYAHAMMRQQGLVQKEGGALNKEAKSAFEPYQQQFSALNTMHSLLDDPNSVDQKQLGAMAARLTEGKGQRLLQSLVESLGAPASVQGNATAAANWVLGQAKSGLQPEQANAFRANLIKHQNLLEDEYGDIKQQFGGRAALVAPDLGSDKVQTAVSAYSPDNILGKLHQRSQSFGSQGGQVGAPNAPQYQKPATGLSSYFGNLMKAATGQSGSPQAQTPPTQAPGQKIRVKRLSDGQTGSIDPHEFDPSLYQQVQ